MTDRTAVFDLGSWSIKAGHAHSPLSVEADLPPLVTPTRVKVYDLSDGGAVDALMQGPEEPASQSQDQGGGGENGRASSPPPRGSAFAGRHFNESAPVENGVIRDWDQVEALWHYILYEQLGWEKGNEGSVLISEKVLASSKLQRELTTQLMFEKFNTSGLYMANQARLSLGSYGKVSGCVVDIGHGEVGVSCVTDGQLQAPSCERLPFGGKQLTDYFRAAPGIRATAGGAALTQKQLEDLKHECMEVSSSSQAYRQEVAAGERRAHILPDGTMVSIGAEAKEAGEILFQPQAFGFACMNIVDMIHASISWTSDLPVKKMLSESLLVVGCGSATRGLEQRLLSDCRLAFPPSFAPSLLRRPEYMPQTCPMYSAWVGGFIEAKLAFPQNQHITKYDYDEYGPNIIHKKAFL